MHLQSDNGPICVLLVNHDTKSNTPVVTQVPPVSDIKTENAGDNLNNRTVLPKNNNISSEKPIKLLDNDQVTLKTIKTEVIDEKRNGKLLELLAL